MRRRARVARDRRALGGAFRLLPPVVRLILVSMAGFNAGFSLVIPFLAIHMTDTLHLSAALVGAILGTRMAAQQGMFVFGGALGDRFGARNMVLLGLCVRVVGLLVVGIAVSPTGLLVGVVLIGVAAALFAPAVEATNAAYGRQLEDAGVLPRTELFAIEQVFSRVGTALGPVIGTALLLVPFLWTAVTASLIFIALLIAFAVLLPSDRVGAAVPRPPLLRGLVAPLRNRRFLALAVPTSLYLAAQNLFYVLLPFQIGAEFVGYFYIGAALVVIVGQAPMRVLARSTTPARSLVGGFLVTALAFAVPWLAVRASGGDGDVTVPVWAVIVWTILLQVGQMLIMPTVRDALARTAGETSLGSHFGMFNTIGGVFALAVAWASGVVMDSTPGDDATVWSLNALVFVVTAAAVALVLRALRRGSAPARPRSAGAAADLAVRPEHDEHDEHDEHGRPRDDTTG